MADKVRFYTQYDPPPATGTGDFEPSLTRQEFLQESDINNILKQYQTQGILPETRPDGVYADFTDPAYADYQQAQNMVLEAQYLFERIPAKVRERFNNDPASLILFVQDPTNQEEAHKLGLLRDDYKSPSTPPEPTKGATAPQTPTAT